MPDVEIKPQKYKDERPPEHFAPFHARVRAGEPEAVYEIVRIVTVLHALIAFRARGIGSENVPTGPVIFAPNHASFMDHFFTGAFVRRRIQFMAKSQLFSSPLPTYIFSHGGVFPVRRGAHDDEAFISAAKILERGGAIGMYCEGGRSRNGQVGAEARPGIGRLALESGAPVVPVAILGSHQVRNWSRLQFPKVTVSYATPLRFAAVPAPTRDQQQEAADIILERIRSHHTELVRVGHRRATRPHAVA
ncbi:MAG: lysophospholipid acyltransferase family protein [Solirubrobacteraceae bacterium]